MKKCILGIMICISFLAIGCSGETEETETEEALDMEIHVTACPENADNRQAKISTILSAGETSVDIFSVNDEMVSEFKYKGYLEPLNDRVMTEDIISCYPESYIKNIAMLDGEIYSVPYYMDIMVFWVNKSMTGDLEIRTEEDFLRLLNTDSLELREIWRHQREQVTWEQPALCQHFCIQRDYGYLCKSRGLQRGFYPGGASPGICGEHYKHSYLAVCAEQSFRPQRSGVPLPGIRRQPGRKYCLFRIYEPPSRKTGYHPGRRPGYSRL